MNIAFKVLYTTQGSSLTIKGDTLVDDDLRKLWIKKEGLTSVNYAEEKMAPGFRLPSLAELKQLSSAFQKHEEKTGKNALVELRWERDYAYLSREEYVNSKRETLQRAFNFGSYTDESLYPEDAAYVLWVKDLGPKNE